MSASLQPVIRVLRRTAALLVDGLLIVTTPLVEKNPAKTLATRAPVVLSMARVVVLGFAVAVLRHVWRAGVVGWPDATLSMSVVLALPVVGALERVRPSEVVSLARTLVGRFGHGEGAGAWSAPGQASTEPSKFDDHRSDGQHLASAAGAEDGDGSAAADGESAGASQADGDGSDSDATGAERRRAEVRP
jgi:hypothetical protein